ncbi:MAG: GNAT family N-acetyltransferase, partial [Acidimicrobiales bacterium]
MPLPLPDPELVDRARGVRLRPWRATPHDVAGLIAAWCDPVVVAANGVPADVSAARAQRWIEGDAERRARGVSLDLVISPLAAGAVRDDAEPVWGEVGLRRFDPVARRAEVG